MRNRKHLPNTRAANLIPRMHLIGSYSLLFAGRLFTRCGDKAALHTDCANEAVIVSTDQHSLLGASVARRDGEDNVSQIIVCIGYAFLQKHHVDATGDLLPFHLSCRSQCEETCSDLIVGLMNAVKDGKTSDQSWMA